MTAKQTLAAHLADRHRQVRVPARATLADLKRLHARDHHRRSLSHYHLADGETNRGPDDRPSGWYTGLDVRERSR